MRTKREIIAALVIIPLFAGSLQSQQCGAPVGSVVAYMGTQIPNGWMVADGRPLPANPSFSALLAAIGTAHGAGYDENGAKVADFNLPDLRGYFLRGLDRSESGAPSGRDSDPAHRTAPRPGSNSGIAVGSVQTDATRLPRDPASPFKTGDDSPDHSHAFADAHFAEVQGGNQGLLGNKGDSDTDNGPIEHNDNTRGASVRHQHTVTGGGDRETRPMNVAVIWIICVR